MCFELRVRARTTIRVTVTVTVTVTVELLSFFVPVKVRFGTWASASAQA